MKKFNLILFFIISFFEIGNCDLHLFLEPKSFAEAIQSCKDKGMGLVIIDKEEKQEQLNILLGQSSSNFGIIDKQGVWQGVWIGLSRTVPDKNYYYNNGIFNQRLTNYTHWYPPDPTLGSHEQAAFAFDNKKNKKDFVWIDGPDSWKMAYVCEDISLFTISNEEVSYFEAKNYCESLNQRLVQIDSQFKQKLVDDFLTINCYHSGHNKFWTAGNNLQGCGYKWWEKCESNSIKYENFDPKLFSNRNIGCISLYGSCCDNTLKSKWHLDNCSNQRLPLCENPS